MSELHTSVCGTGNAALQGSQTKSCQDRFLNVISIQLNAAISETAAIDGQFFFSCHYQEQQWVLMKHSAQGSSVLTRGVRPSGLRERETGETQERAGVHEEEVGRQLTSLEAAAV